MFIGSARIDENGRISGGRAGDQTGAEVAIEDYYKSSKGWRAFRAKDAIKQRGLAHAMRDACKNPNIGYDQSERNSLFKEAEKHLFNISLVSTPVECDCSSLVRVCCAFVGVGLPDFSTANEADILLSSGYFDEIKFTQTTGKGLKAGDILVTKTKGHTVIVVSTDDDGIDPVVEGDDMQTIKRGSRGGDVATAQSLLISKFSISCGDCGVDGDFGGDTERATRVFQGRKNLTPDAIIGPKTWNALLHDLK